LIGYIVNRVLPEELSEQDIPEYLENRISQQKEYLGKIETLFGEQVLASVPEFERDITGLDMIARMAEAMFGGEAV
ncbi:MAG: ArsA-related P-loop ATPase, partial [Anaerolineae bacterium]